MTITPQAGDFVLVDIRSDVGKLVHFLQWLNGGKGHYEHVATYDGHGGLYEATPRNGIQHNPLTEYDPKSLFWSTGIINPSDHQRECIIEFAEQCIGIDYSFLDYAALAAHHFHLWVPGLRHYIETIKHMICSQFVDRGYSTSAQMVAKLYNEVGIELFKDGRWDGYVTPDDLYQLLLTTSGLEFTK